VVGMGSVLIVLDLQAWVEITFYLVVYSPAIGIETYDKAQYEPNSLFKALRDRLSTTTKPKSSE
jgi:hypothetical protein